MSAGYFDQPAGRRAPQIGYGSGGYFPVDPRMASDPLTEAERESLLGMVAGRTMQGASALLDLIDTPASWLRDVVSGQELGSGTTPGQMLESWDLQPDANALGGWGRPAAEFAAGVLVDPLNVIGGGASKAGITALKAGLPRTAQVAASRAKIAANAVGDSYAKNALESFSKNFNGKTADLLTDQDLLARPLVGPRMASRGQTLRELADAQAGAVRGTKTFSNTDAYDELLGTVGSQKNLDGILDQPLRYDIGLKLPLSDQVLYGMNVPGGERLASGLDLAGQSLRWSAPGRAANAMVNNDLSGAMDEKGQIIGLAVNDTKRQMGEEGRRLVNQTIAPLAKVINASKDPAALNRVLRRAIEGYADPGDAAILAANPEIGQFITNWHRPGGLKETMNKMRRTAGLASNEFTDNYGGDYFPRHTNDENFLDRIEELGLAPQPVGAKAHSAMTGDQLGRVSPMYTPGGTDFLNRLSRDKRIAGRARTANTDDEAAGYILQEIQSEVGRRFPTGRLPNGDPVPMYGLGDARRLADIMHQMDPSSIGKVDLFGASPLEDLSRYIVGNYQGVGVNNATFDILDGVAKKGGPAYIKGGNHDSVANVLTRNLGINSVDESGGAIGPLPPGMSRIAGGKQQMEDRLGRFANANGQVDLSAVSVDDDTIRRITRMKEYYAKPELHNALTKATDAITRMWKAPLLAWPAKFTRDWLGGVVMNIVELGSPGDVMRGYGATKSLMQGRLDELDDFLGRVPMYQNVPPADRIRRYQEDLAAYDMMGRGRSMDMAGATQDIAKGTHTIDQFLPGSSPDTTLAYQAYDAMGALAGGKGPLPTKNAAYSELFDPEGWKPGNFFKGLVDERNNTNAITRYGARQGDITDKINRLAGYNGMLLQGFNPRVAAAKAKKLHIDYSSLTTFERDYLRRLAPFYAYTSRMSMNAAEMIGANPSGRYAQLTMRAPRDIMENGKDDEGYVPESIRNSYGMPSSGFGTPFGGAKEGVQPWITDVDIPGIDQINMFQPVFDANGSLDASGSLFKSAEDIIGKNANPLIKATWEMGTGIDTFTKRPIKDMDTAAGQIAEELLGIHPDSAYGQAIRAAKPILDASPFAPRVLQIMNRMIDEEKVPDIRDRAFQTGVNMFSGVKFQNVDDQTRRRDARKKIAELLEDDPLVRSFTQPFIPQEAIPFADPELVDLMSLDRQLSRELKAERDLQHGIVPTRRRRARNTQPTSYFE
jgi:hypothetical protein